jgi:sulfite exporter TauE/SafE
MKKNVGSIDRILRMVLGVLIIAWGVYAQNWWGLVGIVPLMTGFLNYCPLYCPLKLSTIKRGDNKD